MQNSTGWEGRVQNLKIHQIIVENDPLTDFSLYLMLTNGYELIYFQKTKQKTLGKIQANKEN